MGKIIDTVNIFKIIFPKGIFIVKLCRSTGWIEILRRVSYFVFKITKYLGNVTFEYLALKLLAGRRR